RADHAAPTTPRRPRRADHDTDRLIVRARRAGGAGQARFLVGLYLPTGGLAVHSCSRQRGITRDANRLATPSASTPSRPHSSPDIAH
ncbi:MAG: hypothetical protein ACYDDU_18420, partial [Dermatophilaceae bacterium]